MDNRVFYGQYSLKHWLELLLKGNITLPDYQRFFVWNQNKVTMLIETLKKKQFVPPITIGAFYEDGANQNLILDGQQRLTSILLAHLSLYPDVVTFKATQERLASENDDEADEEVQLDDILAWDFRQLTVKGKSKLEILDRIIPGNYKQVNFGINDGFLKGTFLGFAYLVPDTQNQQVQQKYYSSVFRNINIQGETLLPLESRASLYFLNKELKEFFDPPLMKSHVQKSSNVENKIDFVRFIALLSQYAINDSSQEIARGFKSKMEKLYEEYIYSVVGEQPSALFKEFSEIFPQGAYHERFQRLGVTMHELDTPKQFNSIIETDIYLFGLIYSILFENKTIDTARKAELNAQLQEAISLFRDEPGHKRAPSSLKYLRARMDRSIEIYDQYTNE